MDDQNATAGHQDHATPCYFPRLPLPPNGEKPAPDSAPGVPRIGHAGPYPGPERLGLMFLAMRDGVYATAKAHSVPTRTLASWFSEYGTLAAVTEWLRAETLGSFLRAEQSIYRELETRLPSWPNDELGMTFRKLVEARALVPAQQAAAQAAPALAAAQATVTVKVEGADGEARVIDLGPPPEES